MVLINTGELAMYMGDRVGIVQMLYRVKGEIKMEREGEVGIQVINSLLVVVQRR